MHLREQGKDIVKQRKDENWNIGIDYVFMNKRRSDGRT